MIFLSWSSVLNYDINHKGATAKPAFDVEQDQELSKTGFSVNNARVLVGSGLETFEKGKSALQNWRHFNLNWAFVDPKTPIQSGIKFCVCTKQIFPWILMPLEILFVDESRDTNNNKASFSFGSGTLQGHLLAGEERFSITMDNNEDVWYEILSFSKPANILSHVGYPYVRFSQKKFANESTTAMKKHLSA
ncbi:hypothetical protein F511_02758 [Dorcoceras hygrometricum]|uniref:DUF1990 domain-containing protein n=1 Tax=Dorcoceras hygrometricum TaxID=472368 RepID=A0A2Z7DFU4_9LAMI|nr:hypothetical protein F511_02758 [Dorcoceras hygrometricum]